MDAAYRERLERARLKNLEYMRHLDEQQAAADADALLASVAREYGAEYATGAKTFDDLQHARSSASSTKQQLNKKKVAGSSAATANTSVYITGLTTYIACRQLEALCAKIGKVRRIKFYKDDRGGLKGDATVTFSSPATARKAIERVTIRAARHRIGHSRSALYDRLIGWLDDIRTRQLEHFEIKPGVLLTATAADFSAKQAPPASDSVDHTAATDVTAAAGATLSDGSQAATLQQLRQRQSELQLNEPSQSQTLVLERVWDPLAAPLDASAFCDELERDMRVECSKFGSVDHVHIVADGSVRVRFRSQDAATTCRDVMHGRWFDGRQIAARFVEAASLQKESVDSDGNDDDDAAKLDAFLASID